MLLLSNKSYVVAPGITRNKDATNGTQGIATNGARSTVLSICQTNHPADHPILWAPGIATIGTRTLRTGLLALLLGARTLRTGLLALLLGARTLRTGLLALLLGARTLRTGLLALLLGARTLLLASLLGARTLLGAPGLTTRSEDATRGSWHRY